MYRKRSSEKATVISSTDKNIFCIILVFNINGNIGDLSSAVFYVFFVDR